MLHAPVNLFKLRRGIRYTFTEDSGDTFRATLDSYLSQNGTPRLAMRLKDVENMQGYLCIPISHIIDVRVYALPNSLPHFQYLIPEVNMLVNQYV